MNATYTKSKVVELLAAQKALIAVPQGEEYTAERERLTIAEQAMLDEGWRNLESSEELESLSAESWPTSSDVGPHK